MNSNLTKTNGQRVHQNILGRGSSIVVLEDTQVTRDIASVKYGVRIIG